MYSLLELARLPIQLLNLETVKPPLIASSLSLFTVDHCILLIFPPKKQVNHSTSSPSP